MDSTHFISVDWGTSNLRVRLVRTPDLEVQESIKPSAGVKAVFDRWKVEGGDREDYFLSLLKSQVESLKNPITKTCPIIMSGMVSSSIGLRELPYAQVPFGIDGKGLIINEIKGGTYLKNPIYMISGVRTKEDVMRGEEVQMLGLIDKNYQGEEMCFILPGTHSKHILLNDGLIIDFKTYMTGEIFEMLIKHSTLSEALEKVNEMDPSLFEQGVLRSVEGSSLLHEWFKVRTSHLLKKRSRIENHSYLSGLLIGEELRYLKTYPGKIRLAAGSSLYQQYVLALKVLQLSNVEFVSKEEESLSVVKGQWKVLNLVYGS